jgi:hypothetical protein
MDPLTYEAVNRNPELLQTFLQQARRERAEAVHRLIIVPILKLLGNHASRPNGGNAARKLVLR